MSGMSRRRWLLIGGVVIIILGLLISFSLYFLSTITSGKSANGIPTRVSSTYPLNEPPISHSSTAHITASPTPSPGVGIQLLQLSSDPYTNSGSQHQTEVEPGTFSYGSTIVSAFQAGRFSDRGSSNIGWATSTDGGTTWQHGFLPGTTKYVGGPYDRITDPSVAYDAALETWMITTIVFLETPGGITAPAVLASRSLDGGITWDRPVTVAYAGSSGYLDKDWVVCDNTSTSPRYGTCYVEWDDSARSNLIQISPSRDGGMTWGAARTTINRASGFDGAPLVQPNGTVIVPLSNANQTAVMAITSHDGGASWSRPSTIAPVTSFSQSAYFQDKILLNAGIDASGKVYLTWVDCRFETACQGNDLVMTTSTDGITWTPVQRIPIAQIGSGINYYVSGLGVDTSTSGNMAHLGLVFYYYVASCVSNCKLSVGFISSINGGISWSTKTQVAGPFPASWVARGNNKVGDYISLSFARGRAFPVFSAASPPGADHLNEAMYTVQRGIAL
jgi:BNR repeat-like domain